jgi:hypothetical protein
VNSTGKIEDDEYVARIRSHAEVSAWKAELIRKIAANQRG